MCSICLLEQGCMLTKSIFTVCGINQIQQMRFPEITHAADLVVIWIVDALQSLMPSTKGMLIRDRHSTDSMLFLSSLRFLSWESSISEMCLMMLILPLLPAWLTNYWKWNFELPTFWWLGIFVRILMWSTCGWISKGLTYWCRPIYCGVPSLDHHPCLLLVLATAQEISDCP